jgi:hypothetical protein
VTCQSRYKNKGPKPRKEEEEETSNMRFLHGRLNICSIRFGNFGGMLKNVRKELI